jgi:hypothetical protein
MGGHLPVSRNNCDLRQLSDTISIKQIREVEGDITFHPAEKLIIGMKL